MAAIFGEGQGEDQAVVARTHSPIHDDQPPEVSEFVHKVHNKGPFLGNQGLGRR